MSKNKSVYPITTNYLTSSVQLVFPPSMAKPRQPNPSKGRGKANNVIAKLQRDVNRLKKEEAQREKKTIDSSVSVAVSSVFSSGVSFISILNHTQGVTENQRIGEEIIVESINLRFGWYMTEAVATPDLTNFCRLVLIHDKAFSGVKPTSLGFVFQGGAFNSPILLDNKERFIILYDKMISLSRNGPTCAFTNKHIKINKKIQIKGTAGTDADFLNDNYFFALLSDSAVTPNPICNCFTRVQFTDP